MTEWHQRDIFFMREALAEARLAASVGEIPVGAIVICGAEIVGRGSNARLIDRLPLAHAEMCAIEDAGRRLGRWRFDDCTMYCTLEPCPMCAGAIVQTRFARLVFGARDPKGGACGSLYDITGDPRSTHRVEAVHGVLSDECASLLREFFIARRQSRGQKKIQG